MKILNLSYRSSPQYHDTDAWIDDYRFFYSIWEEVAQQHEVIFLEFINAEATVKRKGIDFLFQRRSKFSLLFPFGLNRFIAAQKPDVVIIHGLMFPLQAYLLRKALGRRIRIVLQHHAEQPLRGWRSFVQKMTGQVADAYWFTAKGLAGKWIQQGLISQQTRVDELMETTSVFYPIDRKEARAFTKTAEGKSYLWVGRLNANKDPLLMVETFLQFASVHPECRLYMIFHTDDLLEEIQRVIAKHPGHAHSIALIGKVLHSDLLYWYNSCDFMVSCSYYEGSGVAVCEAMSCGCIPLVTDIPSFNYMTQKACGLSFPAGDGTALNAVLQESLTMDISDERNKTLHQFRENLSPPAIAGRIQELLSSL